MGTSWRRLFVSTVAALALGTTGALAAGNLASQPTTLGSPLTAAHLASQTRSSNSRPAQVLSLGDHERGGRGGRGPGARPLRNSWLNQIIINDLEVHMFGAPYGVEFDDEGEIVIFSSSRSGRATTTSTCRATKTGGCVGHLSCASCRLTRRAC